MNGTVRIFEEAVVRLHQRTRLKKFINDLFARQGFILNSINLIFCSDDRLLEINREFLQHDYYTDIITFDLSGAHGVVGEIYISVDRVKDNSITNKVSFNEELHRVIFHGILHLCGMKDKSAKDKIVMRKAENKALKSYLGE